MDRLIIKGGYGEHGRSCFIVGYAKDHYFMVDCGIMDTDVYPYPKVDKNILDKIDYIFLTHSHKDHSGAFSYFVENGFKGVLITSILTYKHADSAYSKVFFIDKDERKQYSMDGNLRFKWGRSGHCIGSVWFLIHYNDKRLLFTGDYQQNTYAYCCDPIQNIKADVAIVDCAHSEECAVAEETYNEIITFIRDMVDKKRKLVFPLPHNGRGIEILMLIKSIFPKLLIAADETFICDLRNALNCEDWFKAGAASYLRTCVFMNTEQMLKNCEYDILLIGDTHLEKEKNRIIVQEALEQKSEVIITGRIKKGSFNEELLNIGKAIKLPFPHHQSSGDMEKMLNENEFNVVLPFHNDNMEILF